MAVYIQMDHHVHGCHGNHALTHSASEFIFEKKILGVPVNDNGTHEKLSWRVQCK